MLPNKKLASEWILKAENDLKTAEILLREDGPTDTLCFHCQQAVEKYLKAFLVFNNINFEKIHSLWVLAKSVSNINKDILDFEEELKTLDAYYIESRYPPEILVYSQRECRKAIEYAKSIIKILSMPM